MSKGSQPHYGLTRFIAYTSSLVAFIFIFSFPGIAQRKNLTFSSDFEGSTLLSIWPTVVGHTTQSSTYAREGSYSARVEVVKGDAMIANGARSEMNLDPIPSVPAEQWFGMSYYIPTTWTDDADAMTDILAQWHSASGTPPIAFGINVSNWYVQFKSTGLLSLGVVKKGAWTDVVFHMKWSTGSAGLTEIWINGTKVESFSGANFPDEGDGPFFKCGCYKWPWNTGSGELDGVGSITSDRLLYIDAVRVGNASATYADVAPGTATSTGTPVISLNATQTITLPTNSVTLSGTVTDLLSIISTTTWTQVSGPNTATLKSPSSLTTTASGLVEGTYVFKLTATDLLASVASATITVIVKAATTSDTAPVASAGANQSVTLPVDAINLDGSASTDADGSLTQYVWSQLSGPVKGNIVNPAGVTTAVSGLTQGEYTYQLKVTDNSGESGTDTVHISVISASTRQYPIANAGQAQTIVLPSTTGILDGLASVAPGGNIVTYRWTKISGPTRHTIVSPDSAVSAIQNLAEGVYIYQLMITDDRGATDSDRVTITVNTADNVAPVANAGSSHTLVLPADSISLDGSGSYAVTGSLATYTWNEITGPSTAVILNPNDPHTTVGGLVTGTYYFGLTVWDENGNSGSASVRVTVRDSIVQTITTNNAGAVVGRNTIFDEDAAETPQQLAAATNAGTISTESILLYPNPAQAVINLRLRSETNGEMKISIFDMTGKMLNTWEINKSINQFEKSFNIQQLPGGIYSLQVLIGKNKKLVSQFVKQ